MPRVKRIAEVLDILKQKDQIRNIGIIAHVDHGKTTTTDSLLAAAGLLSPTLAGKALALDYLEEEQQRQMTIKAANISLYYEMNGKPYVINLIDTPGHVDFSGRVTRALRAIDGAVVVVDAVEGVMTQTETVVRQALEERVKPVLYINKIDRLIKELRLTPEKIQETLVRIVMDINRLIEMYAEPQYKQKWKVSFQDGSVAIGSAKDRWGFTVPQAQKRGIKFKDVMNAFVNNDIDWLRENAPLHEAILEMVINHHPPPHVAQRYRIPKIWTGDIESEVGQAMVNCDENGPIVMVVTEVKVDPQAGVVATGRLFSGTVKEGDILQIVGRNIKKRVQQVTVYMGPNREIVGMLPAGNIPALLGIEEARAGDTLSTVDLVPFESLHYVSEPVVTISVEPKHSRDLPKLVDFLNKLSIEDPTLVTTVRPETGEYLISGMGTLHLEIALPIVALLMASLRSKVSAAGISPDTTVTYSCWVMFKIFPRLLVDMTKGAQYLQESKALIIAGFQDVMEKGPLAEEAMRGVKAILVNVELHEDPVHRGYAQIVPATRRTLYASILSADPILLEPILKIEAKVPPELMGAVTSVITSKRGKILNITQQEYVTVVSGEIPAAETFDLSEAMRSATMGKAFWATEFSAWKPVPASLRDKVIQEIRKRKGLPPRIPQISDFVEIR